MPFTLFVQAEGHDTEELNWLLLNDKHVVNRGQCTLDKVPSFSDIHQVILLVPTQDVLLISAELPRLSPSRLQKAAMYILEERLAQDVQQLHFALGTSTKGLPTPIGVVSKLKMATWVDKLKQITDRNPATHKMIIPDALALPSLADTWTILWDAGMAIVKTGPMAGLSIEQENLAALIAQYNQHNPNHSIKSLALYTQSAMEIPDSLKIATIPVEIHVLKEDPLLWMALSFNEQATLNLLAGEHAFFRLFIQHKNISRMAAVLFAVWIAIFSLSDITKYIILKHRENTYEHALMSLVHTVAPKARTGHIQEDLQAELKKLRATSKNNLFLNLLAGVAPALHQTPSLSLINIQFSGEELSLNIVVPNFALLDSLMNNLKATALRVEQRNAKKAGDKVEVQLIIRSMA